MGKSKQKAFTKYQKRWSEASKGDVGPMSAELERIKKYCQVVRAVCHTQISKVKFTLGSTRLPSPNRDQQEDLPHWQAHQGGPQQLQYRDGFDREGTHSHGRFFALRRSE